MNRGFTLVELLGIISVLAIFMIVAMPSLIETNKNTLKQQKETFRSNVSDACITYLEVNPDNLDFKNDDGTLKNIILTSDDLIKTGYLKKNTTNPYNTDSWQVIASNNSGEIKCCYSEDGKECKCEDTDCMDSENVIIEEN